MKTGGRNIAPDPETYKKVIRLFELAASGTYTLDALWKEARSMGLRSRKGNPIAKTTIEDMLKRRTYTGFLNTTQSRSGIKAHILESEIIANMRAYEISEEDGGECLYWLSNHYDEFIKERTRYKSLWRKELKQAQNALDILDDKLESGTISDERYKMRAAKHEADIARTTQLLKSSTSDADSWLELAKKTFSGADNLGDVFQNADVQVKRQLMLFLGSNWHLGNKKVVLIPRKPLDLLSVSDRNPNWRARPDLNRRSPP